jgi:hypothetical protein
MKRFPRYCLLSTAVLAATVLTVSLSQRLSTSRYFPNNPPGFRAESQADRATDFVLKDPKGREYRLRDHIGRWLIIIQFGSFT